MHDSNALAHRDGAEPLEAADLGLFTGVDPATAQRLLARCPDRALTPGQLLIRRGEVPERLYLLLAGRLRVSRGPGEGPVFIEPGQCIGELALIEGRPSPVEVAAEVPCRVRGVDEATFWLLMDAVPKAARNLLQTLAARLRSDRWYAQARPIPSVVPERGTVDPLTGVYNRRWLDEALPRQMQRATTGSRPLSVMRVAVDDFRQYREELGDEAGDQTLVAVAQTLGHHLRPTDPVARYGGDSFLVILPDTDLAGARVAAGRVRAAVAEAVVVLPDLSILPSVTPLVAVAQMQPGQDLQGLLLALAAVGTEAQ